MTSFITNDVSINENVLGLNQKDNNKWTENEIEVLIIWWKKYLTDIRHQGRNNKTYKKIAERIQEHFHSRTPRPEKEIQDKIKNLKKQYYYNKAKYEGTGSSPSPWRFYAALHSLLGPMPINDSTLMHQSTILNESIPLQLEMTINDETIISSQELPHYTKCEPSPRVLTSTQNDMLHRPPSLYSWTL